MTKWQAFWRAFFNSHKWMAPRLIPRQAGYKFVARVNLGAGGLSEVDCELTCIGKICGENRYVAMSEYGRIGFGNIVVWREI